MKSRRVGGGKDQFKWDDVLKDSQRGNYLGSSLAISQQKSFNNPQPRAIDFYLDDKTKKKDEDSIRDEIAAQKAEEEALMAKLLGLPPPVATEPKYHKEKKSDDKSKDKKHKKHKHSDKEKRKSKHSRRSPSSSPERSNRRDDKDKPTEHSYKSSRGGESPSKEYRQTKHESSTSTHYNEPERRRHDSKDIRDTRDHKYSRSESTEDDRMSRSRYEDDKYSRKRERSPSPGYPSKRSKYEEK